MASLQRSLVVRRVAASVYERPSRPIAENHYWLGLDNGNEGSDPEMGSDKISSEMGDSWTPTSSFETNLSSASSTLSACDFIFDIDNYIPAGSIRLARHKCEITVEAWTSSHRWEWLGHPREVIFSDAGPFIPNTVQELLFGSAAMRPFRNLHQAGWIRLAFKMRDIEWGQIRVYILPDDIGRRMIDRADHTLRNSLQHLLSQLDTAKATWDAQWSPDTPVLHIDSIAYESKDPEVSLFHLFNTLPSPSPDLSVVRDRHAKSAMEDILSGDVAGLKTTMLAYQRRSAALMLQREAQPAELVDPRLREVVDQSGKLWYCDVDSGTALQSPRVYEAARGGILAETMGLGKTLICLAIIVATRELSSQIPIEYSVGTIPVRERVGSLLEMSAATIGRTGTPWKTYFDFQEQEGSDYSRCREAIQRFPGYYHIPAPPPRRASRNPVVMPPRKILLTTATLVVVPPNLVRQWEQEIEKHTTGLNVLILKSNNQKLPSPAELAEYDIVLFSRTRFEKEAKDGTDAQGRVVLHERCKACQNSSTEECDHIPRGTVYLSPLRGLHFKRIITDEGHTMGNSSSKTKTNAVMVVDFLQVSSRWIVSGTPTPGLYGLEKTPTAEEATSDEDVDSFAPPLAPDSPSSFKEGILDPEQERKDLEKLGNIATTYLKARPWASSRRDEDYASWSQYVMQPRHGAKSRGTMACLRSTLEGMIIRHRPADVDKEIELPPLNHKIVYIEGSYLDKLSLNIFSLMITSNAVTSERKDADYLFHPRQRKALGQLVANLRQASFFWSGFTKADVETTIHLAKSFLSKGEVLTSDEDKYLLQKVVEFGELALVTPIWQAASEYHEMLIHVENDWGSECQKAWALDETDHSPTLFGVTQFLALQKHARTLEYTSGVPQRVIDAGYAAKVSAERASPASPTSKSKVSKLQRKLDESLPALAGGLRVTTDSTPKKNQRKPDESLTASAGRSGRTAKSTPKKFQRDSDEYPLVKVSKQLGDSPSSTSFIDDILSGISFNSSKNGGNFNTRSESIASPPRKDAVIELPSFGVSSNAESPVLSRGKQTREIVQSTGRSPYAFSPKSASIVSTASAKLSYVLAEVLKHYKSEKIIIFYEADNVAYYIAQLLEATNVEHLIYAKTLSSERKSNYIVTFNQSTRFRVLLMDIGQAAFGLDLSSANRVYFVNPVFNKQVEAQAVKRAHRIGQFKPVYVETLVLRDSIEEVIVERKKAMSNEEQKKCKSVLDDQTMYDWIKNVRFVELPSGEIPGPDQMARLETPQPAFPTKGLVDTGDESDPDAGLLLDSGSKTPKKTKGKRKDSPSKGHDGRYNLYDSPSPSKKPRRFGASADSNIEEDGANEYSPPVRGLLLPSPGYSSSQRSFALSRPLDGADLIRSSYYQPSRQAERDYEAARQAEIDSFESDRARSLLDSLDLLQYSIFGRGPPDSNPESEDFGSGGGSAAV